MLEQLNEYFILTSNYRSSTSNILTKSAILKVSLPDLRLVTKSNKLKLAISKFIQENAHEIRVAG